MTTDGLEVATEQHVLAFAPTLRPEELRELEAGGVRDPVAGMLEWLQLGDCTLALTLNGEVGAIVGVVPVDDSMLSMPVGRLWFLTGTRFVERPKHFVRLCHRALKVMHGFYPVLQNVIDGRYTGALLLAASMGAIFGSPVPIGPERVPFLPFSIKKAGHAWAG